MTNDIKQFIATKAMIIFDHKVLILRESSKYDDGTNVGTYDLPGGRLSPGEHFEEALKREIEEETGLQIKVGKPIFVSEWRPSVRGEKWQVVGIFFECEAETSQVNLSRDHDDYQWIKPDQFENYEIIENLKPVFEKYIAQS